MKLSLNFVKEYIDLKAESEEDIFKIAEDMTKAGNEYDDEGKFINATNLVIGEVLECEPHPDSDHLKVCKVNVGKETLQIVCGAPNCRKGLKVIVALDGAKLPDGEIKKGNIRGVESNGMLCSIAELGIDNKFLKPEDKEGIHELPQDAPVGEDPIKFMGMDDGVIDFELTANRGDLLSILGMAYELGAIYNLPVKDIDIKHKENNEDFTKRFKVEVNTDNCSIYLAKNVKNVKIKESPDFIKSRLMASGIRPINNVVDISNYVMLETGQPLHFFDEDTLNGMIEVRMAKENEKIVTLDNQERTLSSEDIVITDGKRPIALAGVMGGLDTEITEKTKNIVIEAAIFDSVKIRKTSQKILRSESSNRFEKGLDSNRTYMAIERSCALLEKYADAEVTKGLVVYDKTEKEDKKVLITFDKINQVLGSNIAKKDIEDVFKRLGFKVEETKFDSLNAKKEDKNGKFEGLIVSVPRRRLDIAIAEDLVEEVGRIYGVDNIEGKHLVLPLRIGSFDKDQREIRNKMIALGLNETLSYNLVNEKEALLFSEDGTFEKAEPIMLLDPMTEDRNALRASVSTSLFKIYKYNIEHFQKDISIFEIGKAFYKKDKVDGEPNKETNIGVLDPNSPYAENTKLGCLMTGNFTEGINNEKKVDFFTIKGIAEEILDFLGYNNRYSFVEPKEKLKEFHPGQVAQISVNGDIIGIIGRIHPIMIEKGEAPVFVLEINLDRLLQKKTGKMKFKEISKYPSVKKDIAILINDEVKSQDIIKTIKQNAGKLLLDVKPFDLYKGKGIAEGKKSMAYSLTFGTSDRTLNDEEITDIMDKIIVGLQKMGAELRS